MEVHRHGVAFAVVLTMIIFASQPTETAAKLKVGEEKTSNLQFYLHETLSGQNATVVTVASASSTNYTWSGFFGSVLVFDDPMTEGAEPTSNLLGRAQGLATVSSDIQGLGQVAAISFVFQSGEFNGSTLALLGHNDVFNEDREMPIVGGTGKFRLARGYVLVHTHSVNHQAGNAIVHYNVTVLHY